MAGERSQSLMSARRKKKYYVSLEVALSNDVHFPAFCTFPYWADKDETLMVSLGILLSRIPR